MWAGLCNAVLSPIIKQVTKRTCGFQLGLLTLVTSSRESGCHVIRALSSPVAVQW